jgi:hypothetical protein
MAWELAETIDQCLELAKLASFEGPPPESDLVVSPHYSKNDIRAGESFGSET